MKDIIHRLACVCICLAYMNNPPHQKQWCKNSIVGSGTDIWLDVYHVVVVLCDVVLLGVYHVLICTWFVTVVAEKCKHLLLSDDSPSHRADREGNREIKHWLQIQTHFLWNAHEVSPLWAWKTETRPFSLKEHIKTVWELSRGKSNLG